MRINRLVIAGGILTALVPTILLGFGFTMKMRSWLIDTTTQQAETFVSEASLYIDRVLSDHAHALELGANMAAEAVAGGDLAAAQPQLQRVRNAFPLFSRVVLAGPDGTIRAAGPPLGENGQSSVGINVADRFYFRETLRTGQTVIDPTVFVGRTSGVPSMAIAAPVKGADGKLIGIIAGTIELDTVTELTRRLKLGRTGHAVIVSPDGTTVAHPDAGMVAQRYNFSRLPIWRYVSGADHGTIDVYTDETGATRFAAFALIPTTGWKMWMSQTHDEINEDFARRLAEAAIWPLVALLGGAALAFLLARVIAGPITRLQATAEAISAGDLDRRAPEGGPTEVTRLAGAVNAMAQALQSRIAHEQAAREAIENAVAEYDRFAERVAHGDFTTRLEIGNAGDLARLGHSLNSMSGSLALLIGEIRQATSQLGSASAEILAATTQQAAATAEEAAAVRQMASSVHGLRQAGDAMARRTQTLLEVAQRTESVAETGLQSVEDTVRMVEEGRQRLETLAERVIGFSERTHEVAELNATVGELAEKSNLLAVNASIEAAKAGEAGRGFAVVAAEVKELADQSKAASAQVRRIIGEIQRSAQAAVIAAEQYARASDSSVTTSRQSGTAISMLASRVTEASQTARQNLAAAEQQQAGIEQIALAVDNIESSSAQTVAATGQVEQSARSLHDLARSLDAIVGRVSVCQDP